MKRLLKSETIVDLMQALEKREGQKVLLIDLDGVVADFDNGAQTSARDMGISIEEFMEKKHYRKQGFYLNLELIPGAFEAIQKLATQYYIRFVSAPSWSGYDSFTEKRLWMEKIFSGWGRKRMDLTFRKDFFLCHYLIDDRTKYGASEVLGEHIMFGNSEFSDWKKVLKYLMPEAEI